MVSIINNKIYKQNKFGFSQVKSYVLDRSRTRSNESLDIVNGKVYGDPITNFLYVQGPKYKFSKYKDLFKNFQIVQGPTLLKLFIKKFFDTLIRFSKDLRLNTKQLLSPKTSLPYKFLLIQTPSYCTDLQDLLGGQPCYALPVRTSYQLQATSYLIHRVRNFDSVLFAQIQGTPFNYRCLWIKIQQLSFLDFIKPSMLT